MRAIWETNEFRLYRSKVRKSRDKEEKMCKVATTPLKKMNVIGILADRKKSVVAT